MPSLPGSVTPLRRIEPSEVQRLLKVAAPAQRRPAPDDDRLEEGPGRTSQAAHPNAQQPRPPAPQGAAPSLDKFVEGLEPAEAAAILRALRAVPKKALPATLLWLQALQPMRRLDVPLVEAALRCPAAERPGVLAVVDRLCPNDAGTPTASRRLLAMGLLGVPGAQRAAAYQAADARAARWFPDADAAAPSRFDLTLHLLAAYSQPEPFGAESIAQTHESLEAVGDLTYSNPDAVLNYSHILADLTAAEREELPQRFRHQLGDKRFNPWEDFEFLRDAIKGE